MGACRLCAGTGWCWAMNSWFTTDGLRRYRCGVCEGTGSSRYRPSTEFVSTQNKLRNRAKLEQRA